ncbi:hypothetical protein ACFOEY_07310 [Paracandidimonas soli]|uniref:hypothetical protein n=1 Tax=Paracandidimonas soli TaxID=1917182 RepID=UPI00361E6712
MQGSLSLPHVPPPEIRNSIRIAGGEFNEEDGRYDSSKPGETAGAGKSRLDTEL